MAKNAADDKLRQSLRRFGSTYPAPATIVLISGDVNFAPDLSDLRHRQNLTVYLLHNPQAQKALIACAHKAIRFDRFTASLPNYEERVCLKSCLLSRVSAWRCMESNTSYMPVYGCACMHVMSFYLISASRQASVLISNDVQCW